MARGCRSHKVKHIQHNLVCSEELTNGFAKRGAVPFIFACFLAPGVTDIFQTCELVFVSKKEKLRMR